MRSIQLVAPRTLEEREIDEPRDPGPGEVAVRIRAVGVCGSDLHWYLDGRVWGRPGRYPQVLGHEPAGEVIAVGDGVTGLAEGQRVAIEPSITCGHCEYCLAGAHNNCVKSIFMGSPERYGLFREYAVIPARNADPFPDGVSFARATLIEPVSVMVHVLEMVEIRLGDTVAIMGAGPIGMLCATMAKAAGASAIFIADKVRHRLELAKAMGADVGIHTQSDSVHETVRDATRDRGVDVAIEASGSMDGLNTAIRLARPGGQVVVIGITPDRDGTIDIGTLMANELRLQTIKKSNHKGSAAVRLVESGRIPDALITHRMPLTETPAAFELLADYSDGVGKVVIEVPGS
ncbi:MAG: alcohol dehydrogenase catalytic domain-containing protein [bacterium]|nr:alcohol dehydrogenase catalytic domain-containing protein [bacterium]